MIDPIVEDCALSVIIPLGPDEEETPGLLDQLCGLPGHCEVILVKGGNGELQRPSSWPATLCWREYTNSGGRARQMNLGARVARGDWLWFLHADSRLYPQSLPALGKFVEQPHDVLGWFDLRFRNDGPRLCRLNAWGANLRSRWLGLPFGDQGLVMRRSRFNSLGGFDESLACGEDHHFVWQAHSRGLAVQRLGAPLATSARKYAAQGWLRVTLRHLYRTFSQAQSARHTLQKPD